MHVILNPAETLEHPALVILKTFAQEACGVSKCQDASLNSVERHFISAQGSIVFLTFRGYQVLIQIFRDFLLFLENLSFVLSDNSSVFSLV